VTEKSAQNAHIPCRKRFQTLASI